MSALHELPLTELTAAVVRGEVSAVEVAEAYLARIDAHDAALHAYLHVDRSRVLRAAAELDAERRRGVKLGPLAGAPIGLKDNLCVEGVPTTCGSRILEGYVPPYDAHVVERLRAASGLLIGKLNMDEFAMGSSTESSAFGVTRNPWDPARTPGGSSGGSACATAARLCAGALGTDTGGSVRQPASYCGITAIKPTYGRVSRYGVVAYASSLDQVGPLARNVRDAARLLSVIAGRDVRDATSSDRAAPDYELECGRDVRGLRVGFVRGALEGCNAAVKQATDGALRALASLGCELVEIELPNAEHAVSVYFLIATAEASSNLARFDGMRYGMRVPGLDLKETYRETRARGFGVEVKRRILLGAFALSAGYYDAFYLKAAKVRTLIRRDYERAFERCDVIATPAAPTPAFRLGEITDPLSMYLLDIFTLPPSLAGVPALCTPCTLSSEGLPIGVQLTAPWFEEGRLVRLAHAFERAGSISLVPKLAGEA